MERAGGSTYEERGGEKFGEKRGVRLEARRVERGGVRLKQRPEYAHFFLLLIYIVLMNI